MSILRDRARGLGDRGTGGLGEKITGDLRTMFYRGCFGPRRCGIYCSFQTIIEVELFTWSPALVIVLVVPRNPATES